MDKKCVKENSIRKKDKEDMKQRWRNYVKRKKRDKKEAENRVL